MVDNLIKARFVEMFGDMLLNPMEWLEIKLDTLADVVSGITKGRKVHDSGLIEVPYMSVSNVKEGYIDWTTVKQLWQPDRKSNSTGLCLKMFLDRGWVIPNKPGRAPSVS